MATALDVIKRSLRLLGVKRSGETLTGDESAEGLEALNSLIDSWNNESLMIHNKTTVTHTLTASDGEYSIGSGADINVTRPQNIVNAYINDGDADYPLELINANQYSRIYDKTVESSLPIKLYYEPGYPTGTIKLWYIPSNAYTLNLTVWSQLTSLALTSTEISLPPGYERALAYNLALEIAPEYGKEALPTVKETAISSKATIKRVNGQVKPVLVSALANFGTGDRKGYGRVGGLF